MKKSEAIRLLKSCGIDASNASDIQIKKLLSSINKNSFG